MSKETIELMSKIVPFVLCILALFLSLSSNDNLIICIVLCVLAAAIRFWTVLKYKNKSKL